MPYIIFAQKGKSKRYAKLGGNILTVKTKTKANRVASKLKSQLKKSKWTVWIIKIRKV